MSECPGYLRSTLFMKRERRRLWVQGMGGEEEGRTRKEGGR